MDASNRNPARIKHRNHGVLGESAEDADSLLPHDMVEAKVDTRMCIRCFQESDGWNAPTFCQDQHIHVVQLHKTGDFQRQIFLRCYSRTRNWPYFDQSTTTPHCQYCKDIAAVQVAAQ